MLNAVVIWFQMNPLNVTAIIDITDIPSCTIN